jgi:hypothetical protein
MTEMDGNRSRDREGDDEVCRDDHRAAKERAFCYLVAIYNDEFSRSALVDSFVWVCSNQETLENCGLVIRSAGRSTARLLRSAR